MKSLPFSDFESGHNVVVLGHICSDVPDVKLCLCLSKPDLRLRGPDEHNVLRDVRSTDRSTRKFVLSVGVTNVVCNR